MKYLTIILLFSLSGCGAWNRVLSNVTEFTKTCVDGVSYLQFPSGASLQVGTDGKPVECAK